MIDSFRGEYGFLSNFYEEPIVFEGITYPSSEHAYQASKSQSILTRNLFTNPRLSPLGAKRLGSKIDIPDKRDWATRRIFNMRAVVAVKFDTRTWLADRLLDTNDHELVEGNYWGDTFWGRVAGRGENWLGRILMLQREDLRRSRERLF